MRDGRWRAAVTIGKNSVGKPKRKVFTANTRHEVQDHLAAALRDLLLGLLVAPENSGSVSHMVAEGSGEAFRPTEDIKI